MKTIPNFFRVDFTESYEFLSAIPPGELEPSIAAILAAMMSDRDPTDGAGQWTAVGEGPYSLQGAAVIHTGTNVLSLPTNPRYSHVVGLELPESGRRTYLHYNLP